MNKPHLVKETQGVYLNPKNPPARAEKSNEAMVAEHCKRSVRSGPMFESSFWDEKLDQHVELIG